MADIIDCGDSLCQPFLCGLGKKSATSIHLMKRLVERARQDITALAVFCMAKCPFEVVAMFLNNSTVEGVGVYEIRWRGAG